jgi:hypothetical protein
MAHGHVAAQEHAPNPARPCFARLVVAALAADQHRIGHQLSAPARLAEGGHAVGDGFDTGKRTDDILSCRAVNGASGPRHDVK